ncbi:TauD/TfdA family dioxygenase [Pseudomonas sp. NPDC007930]|uniref:TauD/TfdA family dioxygenase n=1 Tax=Pseudomonas sp. NPDC007930 TaxID=3364417 RepID=UPI0036EE3C16
MHSPCTEPLDNPELCRLQFNPAQAMLLHCEAQAVAATGGPECPGAASRAALAARHLYRNLESTQQAVVRHYADGQLAVLECRGLVDPDPAPPPTHLPALPALQGDPYCLLLAARSEILLHLVQHRAFAYDLDNDGQLIRFVGNFAGGGVQPRPGEAPGQPAALSSHSGLALGPHTEAPYHCAVHAQGGHSPAPSSLILSARWNPLAEPTSIIPMAPVIDRLGAQAALALASPSFDYSRSDCFLHGQGTGGSGVPLLQFDPHGGFALRYNSYRHTLNAQASPAAGEALEALASALAATDVLRFALSPGEALLINNYRALHCRDSVRDNRRLLIRLFGYSRFATPIVLNADPLIVKG